MGAQVGHIPRKLMEKLAPYIDSGDIHVEGLITGEKDVCISFSPHPARHLNMLGHVMCSIPGLTLTSSMAVRSSLFYLEVPTQRTEVSWSRD